MTTSYREASLVCPGCGERLEQAHVGDAILDVCDACGGVWVDWFDGELAQMVRGAPRVTPSGPLTPGPRACPRCHVELGEERLEGRHVTVQRCGECAGVFVSSAELEAVAALAEPKPVKAELDALSKLALTLQRWLGWRDDG